MDKKLEKYSNWLKYGVGYSYRILIRSIIAPLVSWNKNSELCDGCTVIIGMCSRLPDVLRANLSCLRLANWSELKEIIIAVDCRKGGLPEGYESKLIEDFKDFNIRFVFYSQVQFMVAEFLKLPYVFCWLSWCVAIKEVKTKSFFIHDYDALILGDILGNRYDEFLRNSRIMQGVAWYCTNGIVPEDGFVSTFETFVKTQWVRRRAPIEMFNQIGLLNGRRLDFDILLDMQRKYSQLSERSINKPSSDELVHPAQMIHQYTVFRKFPARPWNCAAIVMIPFFFYLSGKSDALAIACEKIQKRVGKNVELLNDGVVFNFEWLSLIHLNTMLLLMIQTFIKLKIEPFKGFSDYADNFYNLADIPSGSWWKMVGSAEQMDWINKLLSKSHSNVTVS